MLYHWYPGPSGEVYSTHSTVSNLTWRYVVAAQLSDAYTVAAEQLNLDTSTTVIAYQWDDLHTFQPQTPDQLIEVNVDNGLALEKSISSTCYDVNGENGYDCYPVQYFALAPELSNDWVLLGEVCIISLIHTYIVLCHDNLSYSKYVC